MATGLQTAGGVAQIGEIAAQTGGAIAQTIAGLGTTKDQLQAQAALASLSNQQQNDLNIKMANAQSDNQRLQILTNALLTKNIQSNTKKSNSWLLPSLIAVGIVAITTTILIVKKSHK